VNGTILSVKKELAELRGTSLNTEVYELYQGKPKRRFRNRDPLEAICGRTVQICASHDLPPENCEEYVNILCLNERPKKRRGWRPGSIFEESDMQPFGFPFIVCVPVHEGEVDIEMLRRRIWFATTSMRNGPVPECYSIFLDDKSTFKSYCTEIGHHGKLFIEKRVVLLRWRMDRCRREFFEYKKLPLHEEALPVQGKYPNAPKVQKRKGYPLTKCLDSFFAEERMDVESSWICRHCNEDVRPTKTLSWWRPPEVLIMQIHRVSWMRTGHKKILNRVAYPVWLNATKYVSNPKFGEVIYDLYAVVLHNGSLEEGHYYTHVKSIVDDAWYKVDGGVITKLVDLQSVQDDNAVMVFYRKRSDKDLYAMLFS